MRDRLRIDIAVSICEIEARAFGLPDILNQLDCERERFAQASLTDSTGSVSAIAVMFPLPAVSLLLLVG